MSDENNAAGASGGEGPSALTLDAAVSMLDGEDKRRETPEAEPEVAAKGASEPEPSDEPEADEAPETGDEPEKQPGDEPEPEGDDEEPEEVIHGNAKVRLRDGTVVPVGELKKVYGEAQDIRRQVESERKQLSDREAAIQSQAKIIEEALPQLQHLAKVAIPPPADDALWANDPIEAMQRDRAHAAAVAQLQRVTQAQKALQDQNERAAAAALKQAQEEHAEKLLVVRPDLKDPSKLKAFSDYFAGVAARYGFSKETVDGAYDHNLRRMVVELAEKADKWDALQAAKPKTIEKAREAPAPVKAPGRRVAPSERKATEVDALSKRLNRTGSVDDAAALIGALNL